MRRKSVVSSVALAAFVALGCGEPLLVLGDLPGFMRIVAGLPATPGERVDSLGTRTQLTTPAGVTVLESGELIVVDARRILSISSAGRVAVLHQGPNCFDRSCLTMPQGVARLGNEALLIADNGTDRVWRFDLRSRALSVFAGTGVHGISPDGTVAQQATLASPSDVAVLPDGRVLIAERTANRIRLVGADGRLQTFAGTGTPGRAGDNGPAIAAQLFNPTGLASSSTVLYVTDHGNNVVRAIELSSGTIRTVAGSGIRGFSGDGGPALDAKLDQPWAADISPDGQTLFFSEIGNHRVRSVNLVAGTISTFAGTGSTPYNGNGLAAGQTALQTPYGLAVAPQGFLYIADTGHHLVWRTPIRF